MSQAKLEIGDRVRCPRCRQWHAAAPDGPPSTAYANAMLYIRCGTALLYAGQVGLPCRHHQVQATEVGRP